MYDSLSYLDFEDTQPGVTFKRGEHDFKSRFTKHDDNCEPEWLYKCDFHYILKPRCVMKTTAYFTIAGLSFVGLVLVGVAIFFAVKYVRNR